MIDPFLPLFVFILAMIGIHMKSLTAILVSLGIALFTSRDFFPYFLLAVLLSGAIKFLGFVTDTEAWAAISIAIVLALIALAGRKKKEEEEIPPEMIPYLLAMMGGRR